MNMNIYDFIKLTIGNPIFLIIISLIAVTTKIYITYYLLKKGPRLSNSIRPWLILLILLISTLITEVIWIPKLIQEMYSNFMSYSFVVFFIRIAWLFYAIQAQALSLFIESLFEKKPALSKYRLCSMIISIFFVLYFLYIAFFDFHVIDKATRIANSNTSTEYLIFKLTFLYMIPLVGISIYRTVKKMHSNTLPKILHKQIKMLISFLIIPYIILEFFAFNPFTRTSAHKSIFFNFTDNYAFLSISMLLLTYAMYVVAKRVIGLRFLNFHPHVHSNDRFNFINDFKNTLEQLGHVTDIKELRHLTKTFFKDALEITPYKIRFAIRHVKGESSTNSQDDKDSQIIEQFINIHYESDSSISKYIKQHKILIKDEIEFNHYYEYNSSIEKIISFLKKIDADIFLPIFDKEMIIGYIVINSDNQNEKFYNNVERDEMLVYTSYLSNIITLLQHKNLQTMLQQEKELKAELSSKHQEITLYKESIRSFLRTSKERKIGIVFYKNTKLKPGNKSAEDLLGITLSTNNNEGHPSKKTLRRIGRYVLDYKQPQTATIQDKKGEKLICTGIPNFDGTHVIILIHYPEIADIVKKQIDFLKDPSKWDYLLYLETTKNGRLINRMIPSSSETFLNFKIDLLKTALTAKSVLVDVPEKDLEATVNIIHNVSLRENLEVLILESPEQNTEIAIKLFGINPIFGVPDEAPLLETLKSGSLFIKNLHYLSLETQQTLTNVIKYGYFNVCKGNTRIFTDIRIICSTDQNLENLCNERLFYEPLYQELKKTTLVMPSLTTLPEHELDELATALSEQAIKDQPLKNLLALSITEKNKITTKRPVSLHELKSKVYQILERKTNKTLIEPEFTTSGAFYIPSELDEVKTIGKQALKDPKIMQLLCKTFKKQTEIAKFLGVNRSSVSRRIKIMKDLEEI